MPAEAQHVNNKRRTISLGKVVIDASPDKVYSRLARARDWDDWAQGVKLIHTAQSDELQSGNTICYTSKMLPGFIDGVVQDAEPEKVLNWGEKAIFGLVRGETRWQLSRQRLGGKGMWLSSMLHPKTVVTLDQEVTGPLAFMVSNSALDRHAQTWLDELKAACETKRTEKRKDES